LPFVSPQDYRAYHDAFARFVTSPPGGSASASARRAASADPVDALKQD
jgi:hypothetical protein